MFKLFYPEETSKVSNNFFVIKSFFSNVFVFTDGDNSFCIDAGYSPESLNKGLRYLKIDPQSIRSVFLTHSDFDHIGGLPLFSNAKIYLNENDYSVKIWLDYRKKLFKGHNVAPGFLLRQQSVSASDPI